MTGNVTDLSIRHVALDQVYVLEWTSCPNPKNSLKFALCTPKKMIANAPYQVSQILHLRAEL